MVTNLFSYQSINFRKKECQYNLVLSFNPKGFSLLLYFPEKKSIQKIDEFSFNNMQDNFIHNGEKFAELIENYIDQTGKPTKFFSILNTAFYSFIPTEIFENSKKELLLDFVYDNPQDDDIHFSEINSENNKITIIFTFNKWQKEYMRLLNREAEIHNDISVFITGILAKKNPNSGIFANVSINAYDLVIVENGFLRFVNRFTYSTAKEFCYYLVGAAKSAGFDIYKEQVCLSGSILNDSGIVEQLQKYVSEIKFNISDDNIISENLPIHCYYNQLCLL